MNCLIKHIAFIGHSPSCFDVKHVCHTDLVYFIIIWRLILSGQNQFEYLIRLNALSFWTELHWLRRVLKTLAIADGISSNFWLDDIRGSNLHRLRLKTWGRRLHPIFSKWQLFMRLDRFFHLAFFWVARPWLDFSILTQIDDAIAITTKIRDISEINSSYIGWTINTPRFLQYRPVVIWY